ncbi:MAG: hypothetical protein EGQ79_01240 [Ruminococcus sp.]|nr:hypothetical protein [Ruminococcus sp.]
MKNIFNDATELTIQSVDIQSDGALLIKTISATEDELRTMFQDEFKTQKMIIQERENTLGTYEGYTQLDAVVKYTAGILGVILYKVDDTPEDRIGKIMNQLQQIQDNLDDAVVEITETMAAMQEGGAH